MAISCRRQQLNLYLHAKHPILTKFGIFLEVLISNFTKIRAVGAVQTEGRMDGHNEYNGRFS